MLWLSMALQVTGRSFVIGCQARTDTSTWILGAIYTVSKPIGHNTGLSLSLIISANGFYGYPWLFMSKGRSFLFCYQARTDTRTRTSTVPKPIVHNPNVSLSLNIPGHTFYVNSWLSRSEEGPFSLAAREKLILVLGFWSERSTFSLADRKELTPVPEL